jgi:hypothetical protein
MDTSSRWILKIAYCLRGCQRCPVTAMCYSFRNT